MTLEEIKASIKTYHDIAESELAIAKNERGFDFLCGKASAYRKCMDLLNQLEPSWHPFPTEKPTEDGYYQVTFDDSTVDLARWKDGSWTFNPKIIAWKEKDKPYKKED